jgi:hypothetical protein
LLAQPRIILFAQRQKAFSQALDDYQNALAAVLAQYLGE